MARFVVPSLSYQPAAEPDPLAHIQFTLKNRMNSEFINAKLVEFNKRTDLYKCEWIDAMLEDDGNSQNTGTFWYMYDETHLYAAISNDEPENHNGYLFYYSSNSCSFERIHIEGHPELSPGRVMRAFNLSRIFHQTRGMSFIYWGMVIRDATNFNLAMGSQPLEKIMDVNAVANAPGMLDYFQRMLDDPELTVDGLVEWLQYDERRGNNLLFFYADVSKLEGRPPTANNIIQYLLPKSKKLAGSRKRPKKKRRKRSYKQSR